MVKNAAKRIKTTIKFISESPKLRKEVATVVAEHCSHFVDTDRVGPAFPEQKDVDRFSGTLSQRNNPNAGKKPDRHYRRALGLMYQSLDRFDDLPKAHTMPVASLENAFINMAEEIYLFADKTGSACRAGT